MICIVQNRLGSVTPKRSGSAPVCVSLRRPVSVGMTLQESDDVTDDDDDDCSSSSCSNVTSASCVGTTCGPLDRDHCAALRPCHNSGTCLNTPSQSYTCQCPPGLLLSRLTYYLLLFSFCRQSIRLLCNSADSKQTDCVWLSAYTGSTCEIQLSAYFVPATSATLELDPEFDLTQISFQLSVIEPSGVVFYVVSFFSCFFC